MTDSPRDLELEPINLREHEPKIVTTSHAILQLKKTGYLWRQFIAETRDRGYLTEAVDLLRGGRGHEMITPNLSAFDIGDAEARAWVSYFRGIGEKIGETWNPD
jgi:hypothetical protein